MNGCTSLAMDPAEFEHWATVFQQNFPDHPMRKELYKTWYPTAAKLGFGLLVRDCYEDCSDELA